MQGQAKQLEDGTFISMSQKNSLREMCNSKQNEQIERSEALTYDGIMFFVCLFITRISLDH